MLTGLIPRGSVMFYDTRERDRKRPSERERGGLCFTSTPLGDCFHFIYIPFYYLRKVTFHKNVPWVLAESIRSKRNGHKRRRRKKKKRSFCIRPRVALGEADVLEVPVPATTVCFPCLWFVICRGTEGNRLVSAQGEISTRIVRCYGLPVERLATNTTVQITFPHYCAKGKISPIRRSSLLSSFGWFFTGDWQRGAGASEIVLWWLLNGVIIQMKGNYPNPTLPSALQYLSFFPFSDSTQRSHSPISGYSSCPRLDSTCTPSFLPLIAHNAPLRSPSQPFILFSNLLFYVPLCSIICHNTFIPPLLSFILSFPISAASPFYIFIYSQGSH